MRAVIPFAPYATALMLAGCLGADPAMDQDSLDGDTAADIAATEPAPGDGESRPPDIPAG